MGTCDLSCPYTGKTVRVESNYTGEGPSFYFQRGAWSPNRRFDSVADARRQMLRRGSKWIEENGQVLTCPYTGAEVTFMDVPGGVRPVGMYDPDRTYVDADKIYYALGMRNGIPAPGTVPEEVPAKVEVRHEDDVVPFEIQQMDQKTSRAARDGLASIKEKVAPEVAKIYERKRK